jgi:hypothetical protein
MLKGIADIGFSSTMLKCRLIILNTPVHIFNYTMKKAIEQCRIGETGRPVGNCCIIS